MGGPLRISAKGLELVKSFEGFRPRASRLPDGRWIIGYGHTRTARPGLAVSRSDAELVLRFADLGPIETLLQDEVLSPLTQNEFDALVSFAWNIGPGAFQSSTVLAHLNEGDRLAAAADMWLWRRGRVNGEVKTVDALVRRRAAEIALFLTHPSGPAPVPGALIRPIPEEGAVPAPPVLERTVVIEARSDAAVPGTGERRSEAGGPQAAARAVSERIARILGEAPPPPLSQSPAVEAVAEPGPSVEDITRAIADLAGPAEEAAPAQKGPPDGIERRRVPRPPHAETSPLPPPVQPVAPEPHVSARAETAAPVEDPGEELPLPPAESVIVDDLAPAEIDETGIQAALEQSDRIGRANVRAAPASWLPFALLSGLGLVSLMLGVREFVRVAERLPAVAGENWLAPLLSVGGGFLFLVATYYLYRALTEDA